MVFTCGIERCLGVGMWSWYTIGGCNVQRRGILSLRVSLPSRWLDRCCLLIVLLDDSLLIRGVYSHVLKSVALCASCMDSDAAAVVMTSSTH